MDHEYLAHDIEETFVLRHHMIIIVDLDSVICVDLSTGKNSYSFSVWSRLLSSFTSKHH